MWTANRLYGTATSQSFRDYALSLITTAGAGCYWPLNDACSTSADSIDEIAGGSDGTLDKILDNVFTAQVGAISDAENASLRMRYTTAAGTAVLGVGPAYNDDVTWSYIIQASDVQGAVEFVAHNNAVNLASGVFWKGNAVEPATGVRVTDATGSGLFDVTWLTDFETVAKMFTIVQQKDGATWDYYFYEDGTLKASALNKAGQVFAPADNEVTIFRSCRNVSGHYADYQGFLYTSSAAGGGGALTATQLLKLKTLAGL